MNIINKAVHQAMLPNGRGSGTSQDQAKAASKASVVEMVSKEVFNPEAAEKGYKLIMQSVRESASWTRDLFLVIRSCEDVHIAKASLVAAESRAIQKFREMITQEDPTYSGKIKNLADVAKYNGDKQLTYTTTKSKLFGIIDNESDLCADLQGWWNFQAKHDGEPHKGLPEGYLNIYAKRYNDEKKGSSLFMRDAREAQAAKGLLVARSEQLKREQSKAAGAQTGQNGEQTQQGVASGTRQRGNLPESTQACLNAVIKAVQDSYEVLPLETLNGVLSETVSRINTLVEEKREALKAKVSAGSSKPSTAIAEAVQAARTVSEGNDAGTAQVASPDSETGIELVRPDWLRQEDWDAANNEERAIMLEDKEAYLEELRDMEKGAEQGDAGSNEPVGQEAPKAAEG